MLYTKEEDTLLLQLSEESWQKHRKRKWLWVSEEMRKMFNQLDTWRRSSRCKCRRMCKCGSRKSL